MLGEPLVANRGIDGDTSAGVLARIGDDADFRGDAVVIWIGTNDVLQGSAAGPVAERIIEAARGKAAKLKKGLTTEHTEGTEEEAGPGLDKPSGAAFSNASTNELARDSENTSLTRFASGPAGAAEPQDENIEKRKVESGNLLATSHPLPATALQAQVFVLGIPPMATWVERAKERNATIREINTRLAEGARENGYQFIELESVLADENGFLRGDMTSDGVHLSAQGHVAVLEKMKSIGRMKAIDKQNH
jgi:lysophospholipase L1-like esterase